MSPTAPLWWERGCWCLRSCLPSHRASNRRNFCRTTRRGKKRLTAGAKAQTYFQKLGGTTKVVPFPFSLLHGDHYFLAAASRSRRAAMVAAVGSLRLLFFGRRSVLVV